MPVSSTPSRAVPISATNRQMAKPARPNFSCNECRRLKLKCSREWPCTSCEKRGCAAICPDGEMKTGKNRRLILADTEELHTRVSVLEAALAKAHSLNASTPHPLLAEAYVYNKGGPTSSRTEPLQPEELVESTFGTLTIGSAGEARFVGSFAGSQYLGDEGEGEKQEQLLTPPPSSTNGFQLPPINHSQSAEYAEGGLALQDSLLAGGAGSVYDLDALRRSLPDWETEGQGLCASYWENVNWMYQIIPRAMFDDDHLVHAYDTTSAPNAHKLACVFLVMAIGVMFDLQRQPFDPRGERLFLLGRACLSAVGFEHSSPATVQALLLCGTFILNDKHGNGAEIFWPMLGAAVKTAQSLGLHRDGTAFGLSEYEIVERRQVWWEVVTYDRLQALCFGRPCATSKRTSDTKYPEGDPMFVADPDGFHRAKYQVIELMERVIDIQTQTAPVPYSAISSLDAELRAFKDSLPESLLPLVPIEKLPLDATIHPHVVIHRLGIRLQVAQTRLLLNRPSFARSLKDRPEDPSRSKVGASFLALYESAQEIVQLVKQLVIYHPSLIARWWFFWFHAYSAAVCLAAITILAPHSAFASPALAALGIVCDISQAARPGCRAKKGLYILTRLRVRAHNALRAASKFSHTSQQKKVVKTEEGEDDLTHLEGSVKLRRVGSEQRASTSPPVHPPSLPPMATPLYEHRRALPPVSNERSPTETISTSTTLMDPISGVVPSFPAQGYGNSNGHGSGGGNGYNTMSMEGQYNVSPDMPTQWLSDFSPQWSDQSIMYNTSNNGLISPISNGMPTSTFAPGTGTNGEFSFFPTFAQASSSTHTGYHQGGDGQDQSLMELGMDKDMIMALGIEGGMNMSMSMSMSMSMDGENGTGNGNGYGNGSGNLPGGSGGNGWEGTGGGVGPELDFDLDQWVDGMGGGYA